ncbi:MAG: hypothetical protein K2X27_11055, partial [Candidatus Obscuribacterales bacterium]|nr:hypothetical protein [Candidatus Obscuribacterales bacterium]
MKIIAEEIWMHVIDPIILEKIKELLENDPKAAFKLQKDYENLKKHYRSETAISRAFHEVIIEAEEDGKVPAGFYIG